MANNQNATLFQKRGYLSETGPCLSFVNEGDGIAELEVINKWQRRFLLSNE